MDGVFARFIQKFGEPVDRQEVPDQASNAIKASFLTFCWSTGPNMGGVDLEKGYFG
jgi:hypothetical protein